MKEFFKDFLEGAAIAAVAPTIIGVVMLAAAWLAGWPVF